MQAYTQGDWYEDATPYYDKIFAAGTADECAFLQGCHRRHGCGRLERVLEPACGSGRLVEALAEQGLAVTGFDQSPAMLAFARQRLIRRGLAANLQAGQMEAFSVGQNFDLAHNFVSTFKYLLTEAHARAHLTEVARALRPGGLYVLGFHLSDYGDTRRSRERWVAHDGRLRITCNIQSWPACAQTRLERVRSRLLLQEGSQRRTLETTWDFRTYNAAEVKSLLRAVPALALVAVYDFCYDFARKRRLDDTQLDTVLILRRRPEATISSS